MDNGERKIEGKRHGSGNLHKSLEAPSSYNSPAHLPMTRAVQPMMQYGGLGSARLHASSSLGWSHSAPASVPVLQASLTSCTSEIEPCEVVPEGDNEGTDDVRARMSVYGHEAMQQSLASQLSQRCHIPYPDANLLPHHSSTSNPYSAGYSHVPHLTPVTGSPPKVSSVLGRATGQLHANKSKLRHSVSLDNLFAQAAASPRVSRASSSHHGVMGSGFAAKGMDPAGDAAAAAVAIAAGSRWPSSRGWCSSNNSLARPLDMALDMADVVMMASSLPHNIGAQALMHRTDSAASLRSLMARKGSEADLGMAAGSVTSATSGAAAPLPSPLLPPPVCLICLEMLTPEDFASGQAIRLQCICKGDMALRHYSCAIEWSNVKGDTLCDICKTPIRNLPPVNPALLAAREAARRRREPAFSLRGELSTADYVFDAIRVTWVAMIIAILFFGLPVGLSFCIGAALGVLYSLLCKLWCCFLNRHLPYSTPQTQHSQQQQPLLGEDAV